MFGELIPDCLRRRPIERQQGSFLVDELRTTRAQMTDEAWVSRIVRKGGQTVEAPEGFNFNQSLIGELASVPPEGMRRAREEDTPPPPLFDDGGAIIPKYVYSNGLTWTIGRYVGGGVYGQVFEISHSGGGKQHKRVVKIMYLPSKEKARRSLWNEVGANMLTGDYVGSEIVQEDGETWAALILERHAGDTAMKYINDKEEHEVERVFDPDPTTMFRIAAMLRTVVHTLRRIHAVGWVHRDVKPGNIIISDEEGGEFLSRLIDYGVAGRFGNVRREASRTATGSPQFLYPEVTMGIDVDLRIRDYWGAMITAALMIGLVSDVKSPTIEDCFARLQRGTKYLAPQLDNPLKADVFFKKHELSEAQKNFLIWMYNFLLPTYDILGRKQAWNQSGITKKINVGHIPAELLRLENDSGGISGAAFLDDDKFVSELENHIRALGAQIGRTDVDRALALLQEFPTP